MSLPSSRELAVEIHSTKYFTGKPCKHDHIAPRYTQSGTCQDCITQRSSRKPAAWNVAQDLREQLQAAKIRVSAENYRRVLELALSLTRIRFPTARQADVERRPGGRDSQGGLLLYTLFLHADDALVVHDYAGSLIPRAVDVQAVRNRIFNTLAAKVIENYVEPERIQ